jgi:hypothetical protein
VLVDSDLDWGQDLGRLMSYCRRAGIEELTLAYFGSADVNRYGVRVRPLRPLQPAAGWVAISKTARALSETAPGVLGNGREYAWFEAYRPVTTIGRSIDLYFVPAAP